MSNISQATNLTELTMLALKITEETKRAETNTEAATNMWNKSETEHNHQGELVKHNKHW